MRVLAISFALINALLWFSVPAIRSFVDVQMGRSANPSNPQMMMGVQELLVYFGIGLARFGFPLVYTIGFAAIPFLLESKNDQTRSHHNSVCKLHISLVLVSLELVSLSLIAVTVFLRGPSWNLFWPGEEWSEHKLVAVNTLDLCQYVWIGMGYSIGEMPWIYREFPGLVLLGGYFSAGIALTYGWGRLAHCTTAFWRSALVVFLLQLATLVPLKVVSYWLFNIKYWITEPTFFWNI